LLSTIELVRSELSTIKAHEAAQLYVKSQGDALLDSLATQVKRWSKAEVAGYESVVKSDPDDPNCSPYSYVANHLVQAAGDLLESGHHHIYRGVLSPAGHAYEAILTFAVDAMVRKGAYTRAWAEEKLLGPIRRGIASMG
jgi:hypothetical protein